MEIKVYEFAATASQPQHDGSVTLNNNHSIIIQDRAQQALKPGESYLITISRVGSSNIIIEEQPYEEETIEENIKTTEEMAKN